jgi:hypothetical protein
MVPLLIAVGLCLLVPWLPVLMYRRLPRRPPPPLSEADLHRLAAQVRRPGARHAVEVVADDDDVMTAELVHPGPGGDASEADVAEAEDESPRRRGADSRAPSSPGAVPARRLTVRSYRWLNLLMVPVFPVTFLALGAGWAFLFQYLSDLHARDFPPGVFLFKPFSYGVVCAVPAIFLGIFTTLPLLVLLGRLVLGRQRFLEYLFWDEGRLRAGYPEAVIKLLSVLAVLLSVGSAVYVGLVMNWYTRFGEDEIAIKRLLGVGEEVHRYGDVEQVVVSSQIRVGKEVFPGVDVGLRFRDGRTWRTGQTFALPTDAAERDRFLDFLRRKTGKPFTQARLLEDVPGW